MRSSACMFMCLAFASMMSQVAAFDVEDRVCVLKSVLIGVPCALGGLVLILIGVVIVLAVKLDKLQQQSIPPQDKAVKLLSSHQAGQSNYSYAPPQNNGQQVAPVSSNYSYPPQPSDAQQVAPVSRKHV